MDNKELTIQNFMQKLGISRAEAEQLYNDDKEDFIGEEGEKMTASAKQTQHREKGTDRRIHNKCTPKERKIDPEKQFLFNLVKTFFEGLELHDTVTDVIFVHESEIRFNWKGEAYTWRLIKHRIKK